METLSQALKGKFVIVNLGAANDRDSSLPRSIRRSLTLLEVDATAESHVVGEYFKRIAVNKVIAGTTGKRCLSVNANPLTSSLLLPRLDVLRQYGIEAQHAPISQREVECISLPDLLAEAKIASVDFLKTDVEGVDFEIVKSMDSRLSDMLAIQCELRFQPLYQGEPYLHDVLKYLNERDFEVIGLKDEYWRPKTSRREWQIDGRITVCDVVLFKKAEIICALPADKRSLMLGKMIVLASMLGYKCYAEYIMESNSHELPPSWLPELRRLTQPSFATFMRKSLMMFARYVMRYSIRLHGHPSVSKGFKDEFYLGG
jgi:FkbM family methyltransferase